ncbi:aminoglycoside phosphotransferase [Advenella kashmirensis W13003]|uniref:Aminoglycoside phosphotransferase n=1 Tax=Advenella kashmirensis W13003 TaxID=1424334 RepID=V8QXB5_9BURK|nr:phosphotransferase family protein [Advenella kashmirensis]ETF04292.1 aminoglycoside phosphotransferase [Advenella kashmirensis W13003]
MDEMSDPFRIADFIAGNTRANSIQVTGFTKLSGGAIQNNHALSVVMDGGSCPGTHTFVVRSDAPSTIAASLTREQEFAVIKCAYAAGVTAPEPLWLCTDKSVIGQPFCIMRKVAGVANGRQLVRQELSEGEASALVRSLGRELARLHRIQPESADLSFLEIPQPTAASARIRNYRTALDDISEPHPVLEWALNWLEDRMPSPLPLSLCHCDFRTGNYMVYEGRLTGILDWEFAAWSDPYEDLGWLCARSWRFGKVDKEVGGMGHKRDLFDGYANVACVDVEPERVKYWEVMAMVRWAIIALQQAQRHLSGEEISLELALTGRMVPEMEFDVLNQCLTMENTDG